VRRPVSPAGQLPADAVLLWLLLKPVWGVPGRPWATWPPSPAINACPGLPSVALYVVSALCVLGFMRLQVQWALQERSSIDYTEDPLRPTDVVKPLVLFCQYMLMVFTLNTSWPSSLSYVLQKPLAWLWSSTSPQTLSVECVMPHSTAVPIPVLRILFYLLMPVLMIVVLLALEAVTMAVQSKRKERRHVCGAPAPSPHRASPV